MARRHGVIASNQNAIRIDDMKALEHFRVVETFESECRDRLSCPPSPVELCLDSLAQILVDNQNAAQRGADSGRLLELKGSVVPANGLVRLPTLDVAFRPSTQS